VKQRRDVPPSRPRPINSDQDGNEIHNEILLGLPQKERSVVFSKLEFVRLTQFQLLQESGTAIRAVFFTDQGMLSTVTVFSDGNSVEVGLVGKEGFVGLPVVVGFSSTPVRVTVQIPGSAFRMNAETLTGILKDCPQLTSSLHRYAQIIAMQVAQIASCNRIHEVEERLARWLLMCSDRVGDDHLPLTQELLGQMLGTRRASVTLAAGILQKAGLIQYSRGDVEILNRPLLEKASCECYEMIKQQIERWRLESASPSSQH
jgi:CRP-like cAMP-binding protein